MSISTYAELKTAVANWLDRSDLTSRIPEFISLAEDRIAQRLRTRAQETSTDLTLSSEDTALPSDFLEARRLYLSTSPKTELRYITPWHMMDIWPGSQTGKPKFFTIEGTNLRVAPQPDQSYTGKLLYYARLTAFSSSTDTNWVLSNARGLYLYGALLEAEPYIGNDPRLQVWAAQFEDLLARVNDAEEKARFTGAPLMVRSDSVGP